MKTPFTCSSTEVCSWQVCLLIFILAVGVAGCTSGISAYSRAMVTYQGPFTQLQDAPDEHIGEVVMLGGRILKATLTEAGTEVIVFQLPLAAMDKPAQDMVSDGRFLISTPESLDPDLYRKLTLVTVVGEIVGHDVRPVGDYAYSLPILRPIEIKPWASSQWRGGKPAVRIGLGHGGGGGGASYRISF